MENKKYMFNLIGGEEGEKTLSATFTTHLDLESWFANRHCAKTNSIAFYGQYGGYVFADLTGCILTIQEIEE
jgi:hypothetical protein